MLRSSFRLSLQAYEKEVRAREGRDINRNLDTMLKSLRKPPKAADDDAMDADDVTDDASAAAPTPKRAGRRVVTAKRGTVGAARKAPAKRAASPAKATRGTKRAATPTPTPTPGTRAAKKRKTAEKETEPETKKPAVRVAAPRSRRTKHPMKLRPRTCTLRGRDITVRKLVKTAVARSHTSAAAERENREEVAHTDFLVGDVLDWTPWKEAITPSAPKKSAASWIPRRNDHTGLRNVDIFQQDKQKPAIYEFAVQTPEGRKYPVLSRTTGGFSGCHWDTKLLNTTPVEEQLDRVVKRGCKLYARRALFNKPVSVERENVSSVDELRSLMHKTYDYPWQEHYDVPSRRYLHRTVMKDGVLISDNRRS